MRTIIWNRSGGFVPAIICDNGTNLIVASKVYATEDGAKKHLARIVTVCGKDWMKDGKRTKCPMTSTDPKTGEITEIHHSEPCVTI